jgi:hypothetical protein
MLHSHKLLEGRFILPELVGLDRDQLTKYILLGVAVLLLSED